MNGNLKRHALTLLCILWSSTGSAKAQVASLLGALDGLRSERVDAIDVTGWACTSGISYSPRVTIFAGDPGSGGVELNSVVANQKDNAAVAKACGTNGAFRFVAPITASQLRTFAGKAVFAIATNGAAQLALKGPSTFIPANAGSVQNVAGIRGLNLLVDCSIQGGLNCATGLNPPAKSSAGPPAYAYAASLVTVPDGYRMFFCSVGLGGGWDAIRSSSSPDGLHWSVPILKLVTTGSPNRDLSACDPSVVFFQGFFYMYYGSAYMSPGGNKQTVIQVARSATIDGTYQVFSESGKWGASENDPPAILVKPSHDLAKSYGAGQPAVVVSRGKLWMWYTDDTYNYAHGNILLMQSSDPTAWSNAAVTNVGTVNVDVKWSDKSKQFVMFSVDPVEGREEVRTRYSKDGLTWSSTSELSQMPGDPSSFFEQNIGVSADSSGTLGLERLLLTYMAPFVGKLSTPAGQDLTGRSSRPQWNLYGGFAPAP